MNQIFFIALGLGVLLISMSIAQTVQTPSLKDVYKDHFLVGCAIGNGVLTSKDQESRDRVALQFNTLTPENCLKWEPFNPKPGQFNHEQGDAFVEFANKHKMYVVGHTLFWHSQTPKWVYEDEQGQPLTREKLLERMRERVRHVAQRYGDKIDAWDVVNESIMDDGSLRKSDWTRIVGEDFIEQAFRIADEELPKSVELIYNDYSMEGRRKREGVVRMVRALKEKGVRIDGVGMQGHYAIDSPSLEDIEKSIVAYAETGVKVHITELDVDVLPRTREMWNAGADVQLRLREDPRLNPYKDGLPEATQQKLAERYKGIFGVFIKHRDKIKRVTFWGDTDQRSWLNNWPIKGRTNYPLLFDREGKPKPAFFAVIGLLQPTKADEAK